jgi:hydroxyethylthiazole kinase
MTVDLDAALAGVADGAPLVNAYTNTVTVNDVAQTVLHWGGLPVMSEDEREAADMVAIAEACLLNMGTVDEAEEERMVAAGEAANEHDVPVVLDPVGVGATPTRDRVAERFASDLDVAVIKGNHGEIAALTGEDAEVRGVESVGEYGDVATTAVACAQRYDAVVVASGETDVVATADGAHEVAVGDPMMGTVVGTGCMLGATLATFAGVHDAERAALAGTAAFGLAGEAAAGGQFGDVHGPGSFHVAFRDAIAGLHEVDHDDADERVERVLSTE